MITQHPRSCRALRNCVIAAIIAFAVTTAPIVRTDTVRFFRTVLAGNQPAVLVRADVTR
jgi:hypothetical protein